MNDYVSSECVSFSAIAQDESETDDLERLVVLAEEPCNVISVSQTGIELVSTLGGVAKSTNDNYKHSSEFNSTIDISAEMPTSRCDICPTFPLEESWPSLSLRIFENWIPFLNLGKLSSCILRGSLASF